MPSAQKKVTMWDNGHVYWLDCGNHFTIYMYVKSSHCTPKNSHVLKCI